MGIFNFKAHIMSLELISAHRDDYVKTDGTKGARIVIDHPEHGFVRLLHKKKADGTGRVSAEEMVSLLTELKDWRKRLDYCVHPQFGAYFALDTNNRTKLDL